MEPDMCSVKLLCSTAIACTCFVLSADWAAIYAESATEAAISSEETSSIWCAISFIALFYWLFLLFRIFYTLVDRPDHRADSSSARRNHHFAKRPLQPPN